MGLKQFDFLGVFLLRCVRQDKNGNSSRTYDSP